MIALGRDYPAPAFFTPGTARAFFQETNSPQVFRSDRLVPASARQVPERAGG